MFKTDPDNLMREVRAAVEFRRKYTKDFEELLGSYVATSYGAKAATNQYRDNHAFEWLSVNISKIIFDNPKVRAWASGGPNIRILTDGLQLTINQWTREVDLKAILEDIAYDFAFLFGVGLVSREPTGLTRPDGAAAYRPKVTPISPQRFLMDPKCIRWEDARFMGHFYIADKDDLLINAIQKPEEGWDSSAIEAMATGVDRDTRGSVFEGESSVDRDEVCVYELWVPDAMFEGADPNLYSGGIFTLSAKGEGEPLQIRAPRPFFGPKTGPYQRFGGYRVPGSPIPLSPLIAVLPNMREVNEQADAISRGAKSYKKLVAVDASNADAVAKLNSTPHNSIMQIMNLIGEKAPIIPDIEVGGISDQQLKNYEIVRARLDRNSGMSETMRGNTSSDVTATSDAIAQDASDMRIAYLKQKFSEGVRGLLTKVAWYFIHDDEVFQPLQQDQRKPINDPLTGQPMNAPVFIGGVASPEQDITPIIEIEAYSMERTNEALLQQRYTAMLEWVMQMIPQIMANPVGVDWNLLLDKAGDVMNDPDFGRVINVEELKMYAQMVMMMQAQTAAQQPDKSKPDSSGKMSNGKPGNRTGAAVGANAKQGA